MILYICYGRKTGANHKAETTNILTPTKVLSHAKPETIIQSCRLLCVWRENTFAMRRHSGCFLWVLGFQGGKLGIFFSKKLFHFLAFTAWSKSRITFTKIGIVALAQRSLLVTQPFCGRRLSLSRIFSRRFTPDRRSISQEKRNPSSHGLVAGVSSSRIHSRKLFGPPKNYGFG